MTSSSCTEVISVSLFSVSGNRNVLNLLFLCENRCLWKVIANLWPHVVTVMHFAFLHVGPSCLIAGCVFFYHALPCAQQQPQHRERLETFDDVIRSSLEVTGKSGKRVNDERKWSSGPGLVCESIDVTTVFMYSVPHPSCMCVSRVLANAYLMYTLSYVDSGWLQTFG